MPVEYNQLEKHLHAGKIAPVYLVAGEEVTLVQEAARLIVDKIMGGLPLSHPSLTRLEGGGISAEQVIEALRSDSLFGGRRLVAVREGEALSDKAAQALAEYAASPLAAATLLLEFRGLSAATRDTKKARQSSLLRRLAAAVEKGGGLVVECQPPRARELPALVRREFESKGLQTSGGAIQAVIDAVGEEVGALRAAAEKLLLFLGPGGRVEPEHVAQVICGSRTLSIFELTDAVGEKAAARALRALHGLLQQGEPPLAVLAQLIRHVRNLVQVSARRGENAAELQKSLGLHPFVVRKCQEQSRRFSPAALLKMLRRLEEADPDLKAGALDAELQLEKLILDMTASRVRE